MEAGLSRVNIWRLEKPQVRAELEACGIEMPFKVPVAQLRQMLRDAIMDDRSRGNMEDNFDIESTSGDTSEGQHTVRESNKDKLAEPNIPTVINNIDDIPGLRDLLTQQLREHISRAQSIVSFGHSTPQSSRWREPESKEERDLKIKEQIRKWNVTFAGGEDVVSFIERVDELSISYDIADKYLVQCIPILLKDKTLLWYRNNKRNWKNWEEFTKALKEFYLPTRYRTQLSLEIQDRVQKPGEAARDFITALQTLMRRQGTLSNEEQIERIHENLRQEYRRYVRRCDVKTITDIISMTSEYERLRDDEKRFKSSGVNDCKEENKRRNKRSSDINMVHSLYDSKECCWKCGQQGHKSWKCQSKPQIFCFRCGKLNVRATQCGCQQNWKTIQKKKRIKKTRDQKEPTENIVNPIPSMNGEQGLEEIDERPYCDPLDNEDTDQESAYKLAKRLQVLRGDHKTVISGHSGVAKTISRIANKYVRPRMQNEINRYVRLCKKRQRYESPQKQTSGIMATINATKPWEIIAVKLQSPFIRSSNGHTQLLVIQASEICRVLKEEVIYQFGCPKTIVTSNGTQFTSRKFQKLLKDFGIRHVETPLYCAQHKGVGRTNKVLKTMILQHDKKLYQSSDRNLAKRKFASNESTKVRQVYPKYDRKTLPSNTISSTLEEMNRSRHLQDDRVLASGKQKKYYSKNRRKRVPGIKNMVTKKEYLSAAANHCAAKLAPRYNGSLIGLKMYVDSAKFKLSAKPIKTMY